MFGYFSTSRKSPERRWSSRFGSLVSSEAASMSTSTDEFVGLFSSRLSFTSNLLNRPLTVVIIICFAENCTAEWAGSSAQMGWTVVVPVVGLVIGVAICLCLLLLFLCILFIDKL